MKVFLVSPLRVKMKILVFLCLLALAMGKECGEERAERCVQSLLSVILVADGPTAKEAICRELETSVDCLRDVIDECLDRSVSGGAEESLENLVKMKRNLCENVIREEEDEEMAKCLQENDKYVNECIHEVTTNTMFMLLTRPIHPNTRRCLLYKKMVDCYVVKIRKSCGNKVASLAENHLLSESGTCGQISLRETETPNFLIPRRKHIYWKPGPPTTWSPF